MKAIVTMRSVSTRLCVQGQSAELNFYSVWDIMYWNGAFWESISVTIRNSAVAGVIEYCMHFEERGRAIHLNFNLATKNLNGQSS